MVDNTELKARLKPYLKSLKLSKQDEEVLVKELNFLSNLIIDGYKEHRNGKHEANQS